MMKYLLASSLFSLLFFACTTTGKIGSTPGYEVINDPETKILKGNLNRGLLEKDTSFAWFTNNMQYGSVDPDALKAFTEKAGQFTVLVFGGTWCHDTQNLLPKFYRLLDKSGIPEKNVTLIGVDREKTAPGALHEKWQITNVPTFIILKKGKEMGRVVEYGKTGNIEKELGEIVAGL